MVTLKYIMSHLKLKQKFQIVQNNVNVFFFNGKRLRLLKKMNAVVSFKPL